MNRYIQDAIEEHADEVFEKLQNGAVLYMCGLKGMLPGILAMLEQVATKKGLNWEAFHKSLKSNGQWRVEVY
jgi:ferredoxin--NADP+ reductase